MKMVKEACKIAYADEFVEKLPQVITTGLLECKMLMKTRATRLRLVNEQSCSLVAKNNALPLLEHHFKPSNFTVGRG